MHGHGGSTPQVIRNHGVPKHRRLAPGGTVSPPAVGDCNCDYTSPPGQSRLLYHQPGKVISTAQEGTSIHWCTVEYHPSASQLPWGQSFHPEISGSKIHVNAESVSKINTMLFGSHDLKCICHPLPHETTPYVGPMPLTAIIDHVVHPSECLLHAPVVDFIQQHPERHSIPPTTPGGYALHGCLAFGWGRPMRDSD